MGASRGDVFQRFHSLGLIEVLAQSWTSQFETSKIVIMPILASDSIPMLTGEDPQMTHPHDYSQTTIQLFLQSVQPNTPAMQGTLAKISATNISGHVRIKRAQANANQVQVWRGEPILLHIPNEPSDPHSVDEWVMLDVAWQLEFASNHPEHRQHSSNAFDCMTVPKRFVDQVIRLQPSQIWNRCLQAIVDAQRPEVRFVTRAIVNVQQAVSGALFQTYREIVAPTPVQLQEEDE